MCIRDRRGAAARAAGGGPQGLRAGHSVRFLAAGRRDPGRLRRLAARLRRGPERGPAGGGRAPPRGERGRARGVLGVHRLGAGAAG
eukprot:1558877-Alexandrium_andersonii.AAC.1